jgi:hypothetical protein
MVIPHKFIANAKQYVDEVLSIAVHAMGAGVHSTLGSSPGLACHHKKKRTSYP